MTAWRKYVQYIFFKTIIFIIMGVLVTLIQVKYRQIGKKEFELFYSTSINSKLKSISAGTGGTKITLVDNRKFVFLPYTDKGVIFDHMAKEGDIIIKKNIQILLS